MNKPCRASPRRTGDTDRSVRSSVTGDSNFWPWYRFFPATSRGQWNSAAYIIVSDSICSLTSRLRRKNLPRIFPYSCLLSNLLSWISRSLLKSCGTETCAATMAVANKAFRSGYRQTRVCIERMLYRVQPLAWIAKLIPSRWQIIRQRRNERQSDRR